MTILMQMTSISTWAEETWEQQPQRGDFFQSFWWLSDNDVCCGGGGDDYGENDYHHNSFLVAWQSWHVFERQ